MNLIISLLGQKHGDLFKENFIFDKKKKNNFLLDHIISKFNFCKKIFIIAEKNKIINKSINFKKNNKIKIIYSKPTKNQIKSILKVNKFIDKNERVIILNPDSNFEINVNNFKNSYDGAVFFINKQDLGRNSGKKDVLYSDTNNLITRIKKKASYPFDQKVSAGIYYLKKWEYFTTFSSKINDLDKKNLQVADVFLKIIKLKKIHLIKINKFVCFENAKKIQEYKFWKNYFLTNFKLTDNLKKENIQNIIPSAGEGSRHKHLGYNVPKPLIPVSNKNMFERSLECLPNKNNNLFIFRKKTFIKNNLKKKFFKNKKKIKIFFDYKKDKRHGNNNI